MSRRQGSAESMPMHHGALLAWLLAALLPAALTSNPLYLGVELILLSAIYARIRRGSEVAAAWGSLARFGLVFAAFTLAINIVFGGAGESVLFTLPAWHPAGGAFHIGGPVTLEGLLFGLVSALALMCAILALAIFNILVDHYQLIRAVPASLHHTATVVSIALVFLPQWTRAQREIREAHALRGQRVRGLRDVAPLLVTLLGEALDRAIRLAESMAARGYTRATSTRRSERGARVMILAGLGLTLAGAVIRGLVTSWHGLDGRHLGLGLLISGLALLAVTLRQLGRGRQRSRHRRLRWRSRDTWLATASVATAILWLGAWNARRSLFFYQPMPKADWPSFEPWIALSLLPVLALLAVLRPHEAAS